MPERKLKTKGPSLREGLFLFALVQPHSIDKSDLVVYDFMQIVKTKRKKKMPQYERPKTSTRTDFDAGVTAAAWGLDDQPEDLRPTDMQYLGVYPSSPDAPAPALKSPNSREISLPVLGSRETTPEPDAYYEQKKANGLISARHAS